MDVSNTNTTSMNAFASLDVIRDITMPSINDYGTSYPSMKTDAFLKALKFFHHAMDLTGNKYDLNVYTKNFLKERIKTLKDENKWPGKDTDILPDELTHLQIMKIIRTLSPEQIVFITNTMKLVFSSVANTWSKYQKAYPNAPKGLKLVPMSVLELDDDDESAYLPDSDTFDAPGTTSTYWPNGERKISSLYLHKLGLYPFEKGKLGSKKNPRSHKNIMGKTRKEFSILQEIGEILDRPLSEEDLYFDMVESTYVNSQNKPQTHQLMTPDLCLYMVVREYRILPNVFFRKNSAIEILSSPDFVDALIHKKTPNEKQVYFFEVPTGVKIGHSINIPRRIMVHRSITHVPQYYVVKEPVDGLEGKLHQRFSEQQSTSREVFNVSIENVKCYLDSLGLNYTKEE